MAILFYRGAVIYHGERFNSITHLAGAILAIIGASVLITLASLTGDIWKTVGISVYGGTLVFLYAASTLYHSFNGRKKLIFRKMDHIAIYFKIAGTFTPFMLITLHGPLGWWMFGINWALAAIGIIFEFTIANRTRTPSLFMYLVMGWLALAIAKPLVAKLSMVGFSWIAIGGLFYMIGLVFFLFDEKVKHFHGIWHLCVLGGSICHFCCIAFFLI